MLIIENNFSYLQKYISRTFLITKMFTHLRVKTTYISYHKNNTNYLSIIFILIHIYTREILFFLYSSNIYKLMGVLLRYNYHSYRVNLYDLIRFNIIQHM